MSDWAKVWRDITSTRHFSLMNNFEKEFFLEKMSDVLHKKFGCARCGRHDLPLALFFEHDQSCRFESAISKSSCDLQDEIHELKAAIEELRPPEHRCWKCKGVFDKEHIRMYATYYTTCKWCFKHL